MYKIAIIICTQQEENLYKKMYLALFRAVTEAIEELNEQNYGAAEKGGKNIAVLETNES